MSLATHCIPWDEDCTICNPPPRQNPDDAHPTPDSQITGLADEMAAQAACGHKRYCVGAHEHEGGELEYEWIDWPQAFAKLLRETREAEALRCVTAFLHAPEQFNDIVREVLSTPGVGA